MDKIQALKACLLQEKAFREKTQQEYDWITQARQAQQIPQGLWHTWLILAGRGFGKTRTGAETIRYWVKEKMAKRIALIGASIHEIVNIMIAGNSGIMACTPKDERPIFQSATNTLVWPNGAMAYVIGATCPEKLRGPQFDAAWIDELAKFPKHQEIWDQLMMGLRLGAHPRCLVTTTPRPIKLLQKLIDDPLTHVTRGTTFDNQENLAPSFLDQVLKQYSNTTMGAQELYAEILDHREHALWQRDMIQHGDLPQDIRRIVVAVDPAATHHEKSDETGIIVAALGENQKIYILDDLSGRFSPLDWGQRAVGAYHHHKADRLIAEINKGGDMVERIVRSINPNVAYKAVRATRGKGTRAEPIAALY
ncbi:MAG: terminase family protein, partial [Alphaproteobacteria bacterium]|nr:terminase family protein [Alphaproteobacteria bacterium]